MPRTTARLSQRLSAAPTALSLIFNWLFVSLHRPAVKRHLLLELRLWACYYHHVFGPPPSPPLYLFSVIEWGSGAAHGLKQDAVGDLINSGPAALPAAGRQGG